jgi:hypothetical protein
VGGGCEGGEDGWVSGGGEGGDEGGAMDAMTVVRAHESDRVAWTNHTLQKTCVCSFVLVCVCVCACVCLCQSVVYKCFCALQVLSCNLCI